MIKQLRPALSLLALMTFLLGLAYPIGVWGVGQALFSHQANGSLLQKKSKTIGSSLIGQNFASPGYFWPRPGLPADAPYRFLGARASQQNPTNPMLLARILKRVETLKASTEGSKLSIPVDLVTTSASGLDPHISPSSARYQIARIAQARGVSAESLEKLVTQYIQTPTFGFLGQERVNVLEINLALDALAGSKP